MKSLVYGIGINDMTDINAPLKKVAYARWKGMIRRCYNHKALKRRPTYKNCKVCEEWKIFSAFYKWFRENYVDGYSLDKDILIKGNKTYSPDTCCFVPVEINNVFTHNNRHGCKLPIGVSFDKQRNMYSTYIYSYGKYHFIGRFKTVYDAFLSYKKEKEKHIKEVADKNKNCIAENVYQAMQSWEVEIDD